MTDSRIACNRSSICVYSCTINVNLPFAWHQRDSSSRQADLGAWQLHILNNLEKSRCNQLQMDRVESRAGKSGLLIYTMGTQCFYTMFQYGYFLLWQHIEHLTPTEIILDHPNCDIRHIYLMALNYLMLWKDSMSKKRIIWHGSTWDQLTDQ